MAEAIFVLLLSKLVVLFVPLRKVAPYLGKLNKPAGVPTARQSDTSLMIRKSIFAVSANVPWKSVCLDQALTAMIMLNRRNIPNTLYLGVRKNIALKKLDAHAWVVCNDKIFVGGPQSKNYQVVAFFSKQT